MFTSSNPRTVKTEKFLACIKGVALTICLQNGFDKAAHALKKDAKKQLCIYTLFFLSQTKEARERIKHLYHCELLSGLSEPPSIKEAGREFWGFVVNSGMCLKKMQEGWMKNSK